MIDRTQQFQAALAAAQSSLNGASVNRPSRKSGPSNDPFTAATSSLSVDIALLADQVRLFRLDHARSSLMSSVSKSGAAISTGAERLKKKFDELEALLKAIAKTMNASTGRTMQGKQHAERVLLSLEQRLSQIAKDFQESLQKRAKSLADRQERQKSLFGEAANYRYSRPVAPPSIPPSSNVLYPASSPSLTASTGAYPQGQNGNRNSYQPPGNTFVHQQHPPTIAQPGMTLRYRSGPPVDQPLLFQPSSSQYNYGNGHLDDDDDNDKGGNGKHQQVLVRKRDRLETSKSRLQDVERVERTIGELSQMFLRVAGMVKEQGEVIDDIESLVDDTSANTNQAQTELLKLFRFVSSDRGLIVKILIVTLFLGMVIIYFWT